VNPLRIHATGYRTFARLDLDLPTGCVAIVGENGAGKSSIVNLIDLCLFGPESRTLADYVTLGENDLLVELEFEHAGEIYRVRRAYTRGKTNVDLDQAVDVQGGEINYATERVSAYRSREWSPLTRESAKETQALLERILGMSRATFRASSFLAQGDGGAFTEAQPRERKRILSEILGLDVWEQLRESAHADRSTAASELDQLDGETRAAREQVAEKEQLVTQAHTAREHEQTLASVLASHEAALETARTVAAQAQERAAERATAAGAVEAARAEVIRLTGIAAGVVEAERQLAAAQTELESVAVSEDVAVLEERERSLLEDEKRCADERAAYDEAIARHHGAAQLRDSIHASAEEKRIEAAVLADKITALEQDDHPACDRCGRELDAEVRDRAHASLVAEHGELVRAAAELYERAASVEFPLLPEKPLAFDQDALDRVRAELRLARATDSARTVLEERIRNARARIDEAPDGLEEALAAARTVERDATVALDAIEPVDLSAAEAQVRTLEAGVTETREVSRIATVDVVRLEERLAVIRTAEEKLANAAERGEQLHERIDLLDQVARICGRDGIPALIIENSAIPFLEATATSLLTELGTSYAVALRTQAELKSGDGMRDTLDIVIATATGERAYETFSEGEKTRINLALRIALARLLTRRRGVQSRILVVDEPEFLDEHGSHALVRVLHELGEFDRRYLISHLPALRDSFADAIEVVNDGGRSTIVGATVEVVA
jgi:exonuclease SbcC